MVFIFLIIVLIGSIYLGQYYYKYWFNPISIYSFVWFGLIFLYELKLLPYYDLRVETWLVIIIAFLSFLFGALIIFFARAAFGYSQKAVSGFYSDINWISTNQNYLKFIIISTGVIGLVGAIQHWLVLLNQFGSVQNVLILGNIIHKMRAQGEIEGVVPYLSAFGFVSLFFASVYSGYRREISWLVFLPVLAIILKDLANIARAFMLFALVEFITVYFLFRFFNPDFTMRRKFNRKKIVIMFFIIFALVIASASLVKSTRGTIEHFKGSSSTLRNLNIIEVISPSIYLYFSSDVGVLNRFLLHDDENTRFGENTFMPIYNFLSKFDIVKNAYSYQKGYFIPMWVNTGTFLRELYADFGVLGITLGPFLIGFFASFSWLKSKETNKFIYFTILCYLIILIIFSFLVMVSRLGNWFISLFIVIGIISFTNNIFKSNVTTVIADSTTSQS